MLVSCRDAVYYTGDSVDCYDCYQEFPDSADLIIDLMIDDDNPNVNIFVYSGKVDASPVIWEMNVDTSTVYVYVPINAYYSVKAVYNYKGDIISVIDGGMCEAKLVTEYCDEDCWYVIGGEYNVKLRK